MDSPSHCATPPRQKDDDSGSTPEPESRTILAGARWAQLRGANRDTTPPLLLGLGAAHLSTQRLLELQSGRLCSLVE
jgi:hypothetical protein